MIALREKSSQSSWIYSSSLRDEKNRQVCLMKVEEA
jgi:hypothetical protein